MGFTVSVPPAFTVSVAALLVAVPAVFVNTAWYLLPLCAAVTAVNVSVPEVAPETLLKVVLPLGLTCHCTVGGGVPLAAAMKLAVLPDATVWFAGFVVTVGAVVVVLTVSVAALLVAVPAVFVNTAWYLLPLCAVVTAVNVSVPEVAPETLLKVVLPLGLTCHCTVGGGVPLAAAMKLAVLPDATVWFAGFVVIAGATFDETSVTGMAGGR
jgi:hypothetical protein